MARSEHSKYRRAAGKNRHANGSHRATTRQQLANGDWDGFAPSVSSKSFRTGVRSA